MTETQKRRKCSNFQPVSKKNMPSCSLIRLLQGMDSCSTGSSSSCSQSRLLQRLGCGGGKGRSCSQSLRLELCFEFTHGQKTQKENLSGMTTPSGHAHLLQGKPTFISAWSFFFNSSQSPRISKTCAKETTRQASHLCGWSACLMLYLKKNIPLPISSSKMVVHVP